MKKNRILLFLTLFCVAILKVHAQNIPIEIVNNSVFPDDKVYVAIIGKKVINDAPIYYDLEANNASDAALRATPTSKHSYCPKRAGQPTSISLRLRHNAFFSSAKASIAL